ncbi:MAG: Abi family protein [Chitinophagaceae bacterium]
MKFNKPPISVSDQVLKLKERGLKFDSELKAAHYLSNISYYRLRAYTYPFQDNTTEDQKFVVDISFEKIIELYVFDRKLRLIIFDAIEKIEVALRTQIIHQFALTNGSHWHLKPELYRDSMNFANHLADLQKEVNRSGETFIIHYKKKYTNPPDPACWMGLEVSSIGLLSKIFQNLKKSPEKKAIADYFGLGDISLLENWMFCFCSIRNICAHHGRIWNRRLVSIRIPSKPKYPFVQNKDIYPNKLYTTLCCIEYILKLISPENTLGPKLKKTLDKFNLDQEKEMGFPKNWRNEDFWN